MGEIHQDVRTRIDQVKTEKTEPIASPNCPPERDGQMFGGKGGDGRGLGIAGRWSLPAEMGNKSAVIAPYLPITLSDPPRYQHGKYELSVMNYCGGRISTKGFRRDNRWGCLPLSRKGW